MVEAIPNWAQSLKRAISNNQQLVFAQYLQIAFHTSETFCDSLKYNTFVTDGSPYLTACVDRRSHLAQVLQSKSVELNWLFPITTEKFRLKVNVSETDDQSAWLGLSESEQLAFRQPSPGVVKGQLEDSLQQYEPQVLTSIPTTFMVLKFCPYVVDHLLMAKPEVVADSRRKPQQYESLATPFKKSRRFVHSLVDTWKTVEVNP